MFGDWKSGCLVEVMAGEAMLMEGGLQNGRKGRKY
jgi:hypothetical protein